MSLRSGDKGGDHLMIMNDLQKELKMQDLSINELQKQILELEEHNEMLRAQRPRVGKLPPIDHQ